MASKPKKYIVPTMLTTASAPPLTPLSTTPEKTPKPQAAVASAPTSPPDAIPPPGMITIEECDRRIEQERQRWAQTITAAAKTSAKGSAEGVPDGFGKGEEKYQKTLDEMEKFYETEMDIERAENVLRDDPHAAKMFERLAVLDRNFNEIKNEASDQKLNSLLSKIERLEESLITQAKDRERQGPGASSALHAIEIPSSKTRPSSKAKQGCNANTTRESCRSDPTGCKFTEGTDKRVAYCSKKTTPRTKSQTVLVAGATLPYDEATMGHLPKGYATPLTVDASPYDEATMGHLPKTYAYPYANKGSTQASPGKKRPKKASRKKSKSLMSAHATFSNLPKGFRRKSRK